MSANKIKTKEKEKKKKRSKLTHMKIQGSRYWYNYLRTEEKSIWYTTEEICVVKLKGEQKARSAQDRLRKHNGFYDEYRAC